MPVEHTKAHTWPPLKQELQNLDPILLKLFTTTKVGHLFILFSEGITRFVVCMKFSSIFVII